MNSTAIGFFVTNVIVEIHRCVTDSFTKSSDSLLEVIPVKETPLVSVFEGLDTKCLDARPDFKCGLPRGICSIKYIYKVFDSHNLIN